jgi:hypothetical protein
MAEYVEGLDVALPADLSESSVIGYAQAQHGRSSSDIVVGTSTTLPIINLDTVSVRPGSFHSRSSEETNGTRGSGFTGLAAEDVSPVASTSSASFDGKGKHACIGATGTVKLINFAASLQLEHSTNIPDVRIPVFLSPGSSSVVDCSAIPSTEQTSAGLSPLICSISPAGSGIHPTPNKTEVSDMPYPCPQCDLPFRTPGLVRLVKHAA